MHKKLKPMSRFEQQTNRLANIKQSGLSLSGFGTVWEGLALYMQDGLTRVWRARRRAKGV